MYLAPACSLWLVLGVAVLGQACVFNSLEACSPCCCPQRRPVQLQRRAPHPARPSPRGRAPLHPPHLRNSHRLWF